MMYEYIEQGKSPPHNAFVHGRPKSDPREIIRELMVLREIGSERELAERASIDQSSFNRYMRGETQWLSTRTLQAVADTLGVTSSQILGEVPLNIDAKAAEVLRVMQSMPEYLKDVIVATTKTLANQDPKGGKH